MRPARGGHYATDLLTIRRGAANATDSSSQASRSGTGDDQADESLDGADAALVQSILRVDLVAQGAAAALFGGRARVLRGPDAAAYRDDEREQLQRVQTVAPHHRTRPSLLAPLASAAFSLLGAAAAAAPPRLSSAVTAGVQDALTDTYNEQLRELRERGVAEAVPGVRALLRALRDRERAPDGAPRVPDITSLQRPGELTAEEGVAAVVKAGTSALLAAAKRL